MEDFSHSNLPSFKDVKLKLENGIFNGLQSDVQDEDALCEFFFYTHWKASQDGTI